MEKREKSIIYFRIKEGNINRISKIFYTNPVPVKKKTKGGVL